MDDRIERYLKQNPEWRRYADLIVMPPSPEEVVAEFPDAEGSQVVREDERLTTYGVTRRALYMKMRREKQQHRFAEMVATQSAPRCMTDAVFFSGIPRLAEQVGDDRLRDIVAAARRHGFNPSADAVYQSGLARFTGDPEAFVTRSMGRTYIKRLCEKRGWACEGGVNVVARPPEYDHHAPEHCVPLADDLVQANASRMIAKDPSLKRLPRKELREKVLDEYGPSK